MNSVVIYTKRTCGFCYRAKDLLDSKDIAYEEIAIDISPSLRQKMIELSGSYTVPQVFINDHSIGGCNELYALEYNGKLDEMLVANSET
jgi:glutaredoxin 3